MWYNELPLTDMSFRSALPRYKAGPTSVRRKKHMNLRRIRIRVGLLVCLSMQRRAEAIFAGLSLEELGMRALQGLPREQAINGIMAFNAMR